jgi:uncharacterized protein
MDDPRWLVDEMLGRLARYLRFMGYDTEYAHGLADEEIARWAVEERRTLLTRDRALAARAPGAVLVESPALDEQLRMVHRRFPAVRFEVAFTRCTLCNARLLPEDPTAGRPSDPAGPHPASAPVFRCSACGHRYWEGTHTASVRHRIEAVLAVP